MPSASLKQAVQLKVDRCLQLASCHFNRQFSAPQISYKQRGKIAGSARLQANELRLNAILMVDNQQAFLQHVVPHEVAHLLVFQLYGRVRPHGKEWRYMMAEVLAVEPKVTHTFDVSAVQGQMFDYACQCSEHQISKIRHNKVLNGTQYICRKCQSALHYCQ